MAPKQPTYSDASSSYWPPGWNFERFSHATKDDIYSLPPDELEKMQAGLRDVLGQDGVGRLSMHMYRMEKERERQAEQSAKTEGDEADTTAADEAKINALTPNWLRQWERYHQDQTWGYVVFRTSLYDDEGRWAEYKTKVQKTMDGIFDRDAEEKVLAKKIEAARKKFEIRWVEDKDLAGATADDLRARFETIKPDLPFGVLKDLFLCASSGAVNSIMSADEDEEDESKSTTTSAAKRGFQTTSDIPYLLAVSVDPTAGLDEDEEHEEREWFKPVFKVGVEAAVDELWWQVDSTIRPIRRLTRWIKASDELGETGVVNTEGLEDVWKSMAPSVERIRKRMRLRGWIPDEEQK